MKQVPPHMRPNPEALTRLGDYVMPFVEVAHPIAQRTEVMNYKKWWQSKINWVQFFGIVGQVVVWFGGVVPPELLESASATMAGVQASITIIMRTWFTRTPIEQSVK